MLAAARQAELAPPPPPAPLPDAALLDELLADFTLSATVLNTYLACPVAVARATTAAAVIELNAYLACPVACYYEQILRVPAPRHEKLLFGAAVHRALEQFFQQARQQPGASFGSADELVELFRQQFTRARFEVLGLAFPAVLRRARAATGLVGAGPAPRPPHLSGRIPRASRTARWAAPGRHARPP